MTLALSSPAFAEGETIPSRYTRDGDNVSPPLRWSGVPHGTKSLVLIVDDPDAPSEAFGHWAVFNLSPKIQQLSEAESGKPGTGALRQGRNSFGNVYYDGPQLATGRGLHHYYFRLAALDVPSLSVPADIGVLEIWKKAGRHAIETASLVGTYESRH